MNKSPGQIAYENYFGKNPIHEWEEITNNRKEEWEKTANAVLENQWRCVYDPPEDHNDYVLLTNQRKDMVQGMRFCNKGMQAAFWMRIPQLPKPKELTPLELARKDFLEHFKGQGYNFRINPSNNEFYYDNAQTLWLGWKAAKGLS